MKDAPAWLNWAIVGGGSATLLLIGVGLAFLFRDSGIFGMGLASGISVMVAVDGMAALYRLHKRDA